jgi:arylsulfatase A-like enzyme
MGWGHWRAALLVALLAGCQDEAPAEPRSGPPRHIFLIVIDTLRADHLGCYGYPRPVSPTIDRLASEGVIFENAFASSNNTLESVSSLFTSTTALTDQVYKKGFPVSYTPLQKRFEEGGYNTLAVVANPWLKFHERFFEDGFRHFEFVGDEDPDVWSANTTRQVARTALEFLEDKFDPAGRNFFYIHHLDPHDRYRPPVDYGFYSGPHHDPLPEAHVLSNEEEVYRRHKQDPDFYGVARPEPVSDAALDFLIASYDGEIRYIDDHIGKLIDRLDSMDVLRDSLIVLTSDHGEEFLEHGLLKHGFQLYDESIRVPLIFYAPGYLAPRRDARLVSGVDIAPTLLQVAGLSVPEHMLGASALDAEPQRDAVLITTHYVNQDQRGIRTRKWKLIEDLRTGETHLFDLERDPGERTNLYAGDPDPWSELFESFAELVARHAPPEDEERTETPSMDADTHQQLKALGYVD